MDLMKLVEEPIEVMDSKKESGQRSAEDISGVSVAAVMAIFVLFDTIHVRIS